MGAMTIATAMLAVAGCGGSEKPYGEQVADACAQAKVPGSATPAVAAKAGRTALADLRGLDVPEAQKAETAKLLDGLGEQQHALEGLDRGLHDRAKPARLRTLAAAVAVRGNLVSPSARKLGAPGCGTATAAVVERLQTDDYATTVRKIIDYFERVRASLPTLKDDDRTQLESDADRAYEALDGISARLQPLEPPQALAALHGRLVDASYALGEAYSDLTARFARHRSLKLAATRRDDRKAIARFERAWHTLEARLPKAVDGSVWGSASGAAIAASERRNTYNKTMKMELILLNATRTPTKRSGPKAWDRAGAVVASTLSRIAGLRVPADAAVAHRLMVRGLRDLRDAFRAVATTLRTHAAGPAAKAQVRAQRGVDELRRAQRRFRAAGYAFDLGAGSGGKAPRSTGSGGADGATAK